MTFLRNRRVRFAVYQVLYVGGLLSLVMVALITARHNLTEQGITSGFGFLWRSTGWEMSYSLLPTSGSDPYWYFLAVGFLNTIVIGLVSLLLASMIGAVVGTARISKNLAAQFISTLYVELFRNIPLIVQLFFWYSLFGRVPSVRQSLELGGVFLNNRGLFVPGLNVAGWSVAMFYLTVVSVLGLVAWLLAARRFRRIKTGHKQIAILSLITAGAFVAGMSLWLGHTPGAPLISFPELRGLNFRGGYRVQPEVYTLVLGIGLYGGAYVAEIVRGGFQSVSRGQTEAAQGLGLKPWHVFIRIRLPLAFRSMLPILTNQYVWLIKATTLGAVVGFSDIFAVVVTGITQSGQTLEFIGILMGGFLFINFTFVKVLNYINSAIALKGNN